MLINQMRLAKRFHDQEQASCVNKSSTFLKSQTRVKYIHMSNTISAMYLWL
jgi:hypothetical protein